MGAGVGHIQQEATWFGCLKRLNVEHILVLNLLQKTSDSFHVLVLTLLSVKSYGECAAAVFLLVLLFEMLRQNVKFLLKIVVPCCLFRKLTVKVC